MRYDFDREENRRDTNSLKWDVGEKELPMWVADMDFRTAPNVVEAIKRRAESGIFGYSVLPRAWYAAIQNWWKKRHGWEIKAEWLTFCTGVIPAVSSAVRRMTNIGDNVLLQTPVYDIFFHSVENSGRHVLENKLLYKGGSYFVDFDDLEEKLAHPLTTMMILCNPHNPVGKIWEREELAKIGALCQKYHVAVLSDEIHCDIVQPGYCYTPFASVSESCAQNSVTCISAGKAFNLAGLQAAAVVIPDEALREKVARGLNTDEVAEPNAFAAEATIAAFHEGGEWLDALNVYLFENRRFAEAFLKAELPEVSLVPARATYLLWIDCGKITRNAEKLCEFIRERTGLYVSAGNPYRGNGAAFLRVNIACPRHVVEEGLRRLKEGVKAYGETGGEK